MLVLRNTQAYHKKLETNEIKNIHDFSKVFTHGQNYFVVGCSDYPKCKKTITFFLKRPE